MQFMNLLTANYSVKYWGIVVIEHVGELSTTPTATTLVVWVM